MQTAAAQVSSRTQTAWTRPRFDRLPLGMIQFAPDGTVLKFNPAEADPARLERARHWAATSSTRWRRAPRCRGSTAASPSVVRKELQAVFDYEFKFRDGRRKDVVISMFYSPATDSVRVAVQRP